MNDVLDRVYRPNGAGVIFRDFGNEVVVANLDTGLFYSLGGSGGVLWSALIAGHTGRQIAAAFRNDEQPSTVRLIADFIAELLAEHVLVAASAHKETPAPTLSITFIPPILERFDDLQGLLLIDPIHDVGDAGWPIMPENKSSAG